MSELHVPPGEAPPAHAPQSPSLWQVLPVWGPEVQVPLPGHWVSLVQTTPWLGPPSHALQFASEVHVNPSRPPPIHALQSASEVQVFPGKGLPQVLGHVWVAMSHSSYTHVALVQCGSPVQVPSSHVASGLDVAQLQS